ncbi:MAG: HipA family kinase [Balneolaceae bacterium]|nr:HipA family kinase [Balneolaceae bacterium]
MIEEATSIQFKGQIKGTFNRPIISICRGSDGLQTYFLKYPRHNNEIDGLLSEVLCTRLAQRLHLNTPEIALVQIGNHPISEEDIIHHDKIVEGQKVFGSKKLEKAEELSQLNFVLNKHDFNKLEYAPHILRIGLFDMWIGNTDRRGDNFNLFLSQAKKQKLYVFDHFEAFNKIADNVQNDIPLEINVYNGFLGSNYAYEMLGWVDKAELEQEVADFLDYIDDLNVSELLDTIIDDLPPNWQIANETIRYIARFLTSEVRIELIEEGINNYIEYLPSK